jgi:hypothetical protein
MKTTLERKTSGNEQEVLNGVIVRLIDGKEEQERFNRLLIEHHYLHSADMVGERLCYVAEYKGEWLALLSWSAPAYRLKAREKWIGWKEFQRRRRLGLLVNNSRFLIMPEWHYPNLASRVMRECCKRLSADWECRYGHGLLMAESFVDGELFRGTSYKASGWTMLGLTQGYGRNADDFYVKHDRPKQLWVRELKKGSRELLKARALPEAYAVVEKRVRAICEESAVELEESREYFEKVSDWRQRMIIVDYPCAGLIALVASASLSGVQRGQRDLAGYARTLKPAQLKALKFRKKKVRGRRRYKAPGETTFYRLLNGVDSVELEAALLAWQEDRLGKRKAEDNVIAIDGKKLRSSQGQETVNAYAVKSGRWLGSEGVADGSNEIPAARELIGRLDLEGQRVTLDALHTQAETARIIVQEKGGDYLLSVKGNQAGIAETLAACRKNLRHVFSPSGGG